MEEKKSTFVSETLVEFADTRCGGETPLVAHWKDDNYDFIYLSFDTCPLTINLSKKGCALSQFKTENEAQTFLEEHIDDFIVAIGNKKTSDGFTGEECYTLMDKSSGNRSFATNRNVDVVESAAERLRRIKERQSANWQ